MVAELKLQLILTDLIELKKQAVMDELKQHLVDLKQQSMMDELKQ